MKRDKTKGFKRQGRFTLPINEQFTKRSKSKEELDELYINHCIDLKNSSRFEKSQEKDRNLMLKRCEICKDFINKAAFVYCKYCQDAHHSYCLIKSSIRKCNDEANFICSKCLEENKRKTKQLTVDSLFLNKKTLRFTSNKKEEEDKEIIQCFKCKTNIEDSDKCSNCEKCHQNYHKHCFSSSSSNQSTIEADCSVKIVCNDCEVKIAKVLKTTKISDYFSHCKVDPSKSLLITKDKLEHEQNTNTDTSLLEKISKEILIDTTTTTKSKSEGHIKLPKPLSSSLKETSMKSLFRALTVKNITFNDDLVFIDPDCPKEMNNAYHEPGISKISEYNKKIYYSFKQKSRIGQYAPVEVIDDPIQRFIVKAIKNIPMNTLITEYTGEVTLLRKKIFDSNDSIMELIRTPSSSSSIVICPEQYGNLARFISGINNHDKKLKRKQNVYSLRYNIDGSVHILLLAVRNIKKGEVLYYDYNAGGYNEYPTDHFI